MNTILAKYNELSYHLGLSSTGEIDSLINEKFNSAITDGTINGFLNDNSIELSKTQLLLLSDKKWIAKAEKKSEFFWTEIAKLNDGKKISVNSWDGMVSKKFNNIQAMTDDLYGYYSPLQIFYSLLDLNKLNKYFSSQSINGDINIALNETNEFISLEKFTSSKQSAIESILRIEEITGTKIILPSGFNKWLSKTFKENPNLIQPKNKLELMIWKNKMKDIAVTRKNYTSFINQSLSKDDNIIKDQAKVLALKLTKDNLKKEFFPKWAEDEILWNYWSDLKDHFLEMIDMPYGSTRAQFGGEWDFSETAEFS